MADWITRRLPPEQSQAMEAHRKACPDCACAAAAEASIHTAWREHVSSSAADLWPRIAERIGTPERVPAGATERKKPRSQLTRWALASVVLAALTAVSWETAARDRTPSNQGQRDAASSAFLPPPSGPPRVSEAWSALREVPQSNPLVDDPVGANLDDVWTYLKTENK